MSQVNVAVIGTGDWGKNLVRVFHKLSVLAAICDINHKKAEETAFQYRVRNLTWEQILESKEIDAVVIATNKSHYRFVKQALYANKHVFVEKPLAPNIEQAKELCDIACQVNKKIMIGHLLHYHSAFIELQKLCNSQMLGEVHYAYSNRLSFGKIMPEEDVLWNFASHDISMMLALMGKPKSINTFANYFFNKNIADQTIIKLNFSEHKQGHVFVSWLHPIKERKFVVIGSKAMAVFDDTLDWSKKLCLYEHTSEVKDHTPVLKNLSSKFIEIKDQEEPLLKEANHFLQCIIQNTTPQTDGQEALSVLQIIEQASRQLRAQQKKLSPII